MSIAYLEHGRKKMKPKQQPILDSPPHHKLTSCFDFQTPNLSRQHKHIYTQEKKASSGCWYDVMIQFDTSRSNEDQRLFDCI